MTALYPAATTGPTGTQRLRWGLELIAVLILSEFGPKLIERTASFAGFAFPTMPLLHRTYLFFALIVALFVYLYARGERPAEFGLIRPIRRRRYLWQALIVFVVVMAFDALVRPMLDGFIAHATGTSRTLAEQTFAQLRGNVPLLIFVIPFGWLFGGFGEEMLYRGFVMTRIAQLLGEGRWAWIAAIFLQAAPFAAGHAYQGPVGMAAIFFVGVVDGAATVMWGRNLWPAIIAHGVQDTFGFIMLYAGVAHAS